ncbi:MAG: response regulator [Proteobacteria bacterium]|nr:MAG: response regulator [Pseudomonadota bacterium]
MKRAGWEFLPIAAMVALIVSTTATVYYLLQLERQETENQAREALHQLVEFAAEGMTEPVWTLTPDDGRALVEALLSDERVYRVQVTSTIQGLFLNVEKQGEAPAQRTIVRNAITRDDEVIGHVEFTFDNDKIARTANPGWSDVYWFIVAHILVTAAAAIVVFVLGDRIRKARTRAERAELQAQNARSEERLEEVQRIAHIGHWVRDLQNDTLRLSAEARRILGVGASGDSVLAMSDFLAYIHPEDRDRVKAEMSRRSDSPNRFVDDVRLVRENAQTRHLSIIGQSVALEGNSSIALEGTVQDVTERKGLEDQLQHSERMKAIGQLTGGIAHDFNNLLTVMRGNLQLLARRVGGAGQSQTARWIDGALRSVDRGADLTQHLLAFARRQRLVASVVDVNRLVRGMREMLDRALGEAVTVDYRLDEETLMVFVDETELESAILNLALNARDAMPEGGVLTIVTGNVTIRAGETDDRWELESGDYVRISVSDTGFGMRDDVLAQAFEPFFTTKTEGKGTGLGLSTIFGFAKQSNGHAVIRSAPGAGTMVELYFPAHESSDEELPDADVVDAGALAAVGGSDRLLLVDDNDAVRETTCSMLEELGYSVLTATNGAEGLDLIEKHDDIDLLLTDVVMPGGMNGLELAANARLRRPHLRIICASGYAESNWQTPPAERGDYAWMDKPFDFNQLAAKLRELLAEDAVSVTPKNS